jgi:hypothetical protein
MVQMFGWVEGRSSGLALETAERLRIVGKFVRKELQSCVTAEFEVFCLIHNTHASAADPAEDVVMGNRLTHGLGGRGHWLDMLGGGQGKSKKALQLA